MTPVEMVLYSSVYWQAETGCHHRVVSIPALCAGGPFHCSLISLSHHAISSELLKMVINKLRIKYFEIYLVITVTNPFNVG
jgi:hypothetical protein